MVLHRQLVQFFERNVLNRNMHAIERSKKLSRQFTCHVAAHQDFINFLSGLNGFYYGSYPENHIFLGALFVFVVYHFLLICFRSMK